MQFAALSFTAPEKVRLRFELRHNHKLFLSEEGTRRTVVAPWLPPGTYHLRVTAANNDGVWNPDGTALAFVVRPFYWQIAWLRFLALAGVVSAVAVAAWWITRERLRRRIERLEHERSLKEERLKLQQQLLQAQKMESIGRLAGGVAHDFNNMLQVILGNTFLALNHAPADRPLRECLEEIHKSAQHSADLTRQLLAFARKQTVAPKILDLNDTVSGMLKMLQRLIGESIQLVFLPGANLWPVKMDPSQIDQILANLTVNARDAIDQVGQVTLETANVSFDDTYARSHLDCVPGEYVMLAVSDNGRGMSAEIREHLFEPFFTTKALGQGTGLGLATVFGIVKQNGGLINVYSEPGQGAVFKIYLPRAVDAAPAKPSVAPAPSVPHGSETILLVEDEAQILNLGRRILTQHGYRVWVARTPEEAIAIASQHPHQIDLLITDVVMPGMNGRELSQRIAAHQPGLRRVFMSGYTSNVIVHHGVLDDGVEFLQKPFTIQTLTDKIRAVLAHPPHSGAS
jgi:signal transduction histidine kinase/ActR/RegA family two-component response regulator